MLEIAYDLVYIENGLHNYNITHNQAVKRGLLSYRANTLTLSLDDKKICQTCKFLFKVSRLLTKFFPGDLKGD